MEIMFTKFKEHALKSCTLNIRATWLWLMVSWFHDREIKWQHTDTRLHDVGGWCLNFFSGCVFIKESLPKIFVNWSVILFGHFSSFSFYLSGQGLKTIGHVWWPTVIYITGLCTKLFQHVHLIVVLKICHNAWLWLTW